MGPAIAPAVLEEPPGKCWVMAAPWATSLAEMAEMFEFIDILAQTIIIIVVVGLGSVWGDWSSYTAHLTHLTHLTPHSMTYPDMTPNFIIPGPVYRRRGQGKTIYTRDVQNGRSR